MARSLWILISTLAITNLLAIIGFLAWLQASDRLSPDRVEAVRLVFSETLAEQEAREGVEKRRAQELARLAELEAAVGNPPANSDQRLRIITEFEELAREIDSRANRSTQDLLDTITREREALEAEKREFEQRVAAWEQMRNELTTLEQSEQFDRTVQLYQNLKADQARPMLQTLIDQGQIDQVVAYLNAMQKRNASKIIAAFEQSSPRVAADLLERLRTLGIEPPGDGAAADDK